MPSILLEYQLVIRNAANTADAITFSTVRGDSAPYLEGPPTCDGQEINPLTGEFRSGSFTGYIADQITSGTSRALTSQLEDANFRQQLAGRVASWKLRVNGGAWTVLGAGFLTLISLVSAARWHVTVSDATRVEDNATAFAPKQGTIVLSANALAGATALSVNALPFAIAKDVILVFLSGKQATVTAAAASGATSVAVSALASGLSSGDSGPITESFASYFARWPQRGCLFGGLITKDPNDATSTGFLGVPDLGGWTVRVADQSSLGGEDRASGTTFFYPLIFYGPPDVKPSNNPSTGLAGTVVTGTMKAVASVINPAAAPLVTAGGLYAYAPGFPTEFKSVWPGLVYQIALASGDFTGAASEFYAPEGDDAFSGPAPYAGKYENGIIDIGHGHPGPCIQGTAFAVGATKYRMRGLTCLPTESSPLYWTGHPIDLFKKLMDDQNRAYNSTACDTVRGLIGADRRLSVRIVALPKLNDFLKNAIYAPFGIGVRMNAAGVLEPFCTRIFDNSPPTTTITSADIRHDTHGVGVQSWFQLDESTAIRNVVFEYQNFYLSQDGAAFNPAAERIKYPPDGVAIQQVRIERQNGDPGAIGNGTASFNVPGMIHSKDSPLSTAPMDVSAQTAAPATSWVNQLVYEIFDRWGRGVITGELPLLRGGSGDALQLGDELLNQVPQLPNKNKRYGDDNTVGARAMQIVRLTPHPEGAIVKVTDSGPNAAAVATLPTATIVASPLTHLARRFALLTITNASTLNAAGIGVEVQMAVTTGAAPAASDYTAAGKFPYGQIPTGVIVLPSVRAGRTVYVRLRSTQLGSRASAWTTPISVTLGTLNAISGLTVTPNAGDGTQAAVAWSVGANAGLAAIDVYVRPSAQPASTAIRQAVLGNTSTGYNLEGLIPNTSYTVGVQARDLDALFGSDSSAIVEATFTTANVTPALAAPIYPQFFVGSVLAHLGLPRADGNYGMAVYATVFPGLVEFWQALETAVGSGTYGTFGLVATLPSVQGDWTKFTGIAPHDGLRRQLKARHVRENATASAFSAIGTVSPWGTATRLALPPAYRLIPYEDTYYASTADATGQVFLNGAGVSSTQKVNVGTPATPATMQRIYRIPYSAFTSDNGTNATAFEKGNGDLRPSTAGGGINFSAQVVLPQGATITSMLMRGYKQNAGDTCVAVLRRASDGTLTGLATATLSATGAYTNVPVSSLSEAVNASYAYTVGVNLVGLASPNDARLQYVEITVTVPDLNTGL